MHFIQEIISENLVYALGWTVLHSIWQAALIALGMALVMLVLQKYSAKVRYILANMALFTVLVLSALTFIGLYKNSFTASFPEVTILSGNFAFQAKESNFFEQISSQFTLYFNTHLPLIVSVWLIGIAVFLLRLFGGLAYLQTLRTRYVQPISAYWQEKLDDYAQQINLHRKVELMESAMVQVPLMVGYFKPLVLLPMGTVNALSEEEVEAILAHELAHIWRNDYLMNLIQSLVEVLFYFNPAVWWISANIRMERENCCDDIAVRLCGNSIAYAKALVSLQEMSVSSPSLAMTFSGKKHQLLRRVKRVLNQPQNKSNIMEKLTATCILLATILAFSFNAHSSPRVNKLKPPLNVWVLEEENEQEHEEEFHIETITVYAATDSLPKGKIRLEMTTNGEKYDVKIEDQKIQSLIINGEEIPASKFKDYEEKVKALFDNVPPPPPAPAPPPAPEAPPAPPAPPSPFYGDKTEIKITKGKKDDGTSFILVQPGLEGEGIEIAIDEANNIIHLDGEVIEDGEVAYIIDEQSIDPFGALESVQIDTFPLYFNGGTNIEDLGGYFAYSDFVFPNENIEVWTWKENQTGQRKLREAQKLKQELMLKKQDKFKRYQKRQLRKLELLQEKSKTYLQDNQERLKSYELKLNDKLKYYTPSSATWNIYGFKNFKLTPDLKDVLERELIKDELIEANTSYTLEFSGKGMKLNGEKMPLAIFKKYKQLYEEQSGIDLTKNSKLIITE